MDPRRTCLVPSIHYLVKGKSCQPVSRADSHSPVIERHPAPHDVRRIGGLESDPEKIEMRRSGRTIARTAEKENCSDTEERS
jgi:hypothetical protein